MQHNAHIITTHHHAGAQIEHLTRPAPCMGYRMTPTPQEVAVLDGWLRLELRTYHHTAGPPQDRPAPHTIGGTWLGYPHIAGDTALSERTLLDARAQLAVDGMDARVALGWLLGPPPAH